MPDGSLLRHWQTLARYNTGANQRLYETCARLDDGERRAERGAFFGSIHRTLNHLMIGDMIWLTRLEGGEAPSTGLDAEVYAEFFELRAARCALDARIESFFDAFDAECPERSIAYVNNQGLRFDDPLPLLLAHFFNHQTHHRAQVHTLLSQAGVAPPVLDLHRVLKPEP